MKKMGLWILAIAGGVYLIPMFILFFFQKPLIFPGAYFIDGAKAPTPQQAGLSSFQEIVLTASDGEKLTAWYAPPSPQKNLIIIYHGNGEIVSHLAPLLAALSADRTGVLALEWRGYGKTSGKPSQEGLLKDALAAYQYARDQSIAPERIFLFGRSLGTGLAVWVASQEPVAGLILDAPYTSVADVAASKFWFYPVHWLIRDPFPAKDWIVHTKAPIFAADSEGDPVIPVRLGQRLVSAAPGEAVFIVAPGDDHTVIHHPDILIQAQQWMEEHSLSKKPTPAAH